MAAWNAEAHISRAIRSVLNQTWEDFEFVIVDDGSTDRTVEVVRGFDDRRIRLFRNERNLGLVGALNRGIGSAHADRIARIDADDECLLDRFEAQMHFLDENPRVGIVGGWGLLLDERGRTIWMSRTPATHAECVAELADGHIFSPHPTLMFRKSSISTDIRYEEVEAAEDYKLCADLFPHTQLASLQRIVTNIYRTRGSITMTKLDLQLQNKVEVHQQVLGDLLGPRISDRFANALVFTTDPHAKGRMTALDLACFYDACASLPEAVLQRFLRSRFRSMVRDKMDRIDIRPGPGLRHPVGRMVLRYRLKGAFARPKIRG